ncbi:uncharacterized protein LOC144435727 [Glandiceps talaboti]
MVRFVAILFVAVICFAAQTIGTPSLSRRDDPSAWEFKVTSIDDIYKQEDVPHCPDGSGVYQCGGAEGCFDSPQQMCDDSNVCHSEPLTQRAACNEAEFFGWVIQHGIVPKYGDDTTRRADMYMSLYYWSIGVRFCDDGRIRCTDGICRNYHEMCYDERKDCYCDDKKDEIDSDKKYYHWYDNHDRRRSLTSLPSRRLGYQDSPMVKRTVRHR